MARAAPDHWTRAAEAVVLAQHPDRGVEAALRIWHAGDKTAASSRASSTSLSSSSELLSEDAECRLEAAPAEEPADVPAKLPASACRREGAQQEQPGGNHECFIMILPSSPVPGGVQRITPARAPAPQIHGRLVSDRLHWSRVPLSHSCESTHAHLDAGLETKIGTWNTNEELPITVHASPPCLPNLRLVKPHYYDAALNQDPHAFYAGLRPFAVCRTSDFMFRGREGYMVTDSRMFASS